MILTDPPSGPHTFSRIVSLVPSQTELLFDLGLENEVVGITKFCVHPQKWFRSKTRVGGTKQIHPEIIERLRPDLIIANKEENTKEQVETLAQEYDVFVTDIHSLPDALQMIRHVGRLTGTFAKADRMAAEIQDRFSLLKNRASAKPRKKAVYLIWQQPYMAAGSGTFINDMMEHCGLDNIFKDIPRYPETSIEDMAARGADMILLSSEPYPFRQKHADAFKNLLPGREVTLVDGEMFSWYGSRLLHSAGYLRKLFDEPAR